MRPLVQKLTQPGNPREVCGKRVSGIQFQKKPTGVLSAGAKFLRLANYGVGWRTLCGIVFWLEPKERGSDATSGPTVEPTRWPKGGLRKDSDWTSGLAIILRYLVYGHGLLEVDGSWRVLTHAVWYFRMVTNLLALGWTNCAGRTGPGDLVSAWLLPSQGDRAAQCTLSTPGSTPQLLCMVKLHVIT